MRKRIFAFVAAVSFLVAASACSYFKSESRNETEKSSVTFSETDSETSFTVGTSVKPTETTTESLASETEETTDTSCASEAVSQTDATLSDATQTDADVTGSTCADAGKPSYLKNFKVGSDYFIGYDKTNDVVLFEKDADKRCYPASVTKIVTAIVAIENVPLDTKMKVGGELGYVAKYSSVAGLKSGQVLTLEDLLYGMILPSGNDAALTIAVNTARYLYGSELGVSEAKKRFMDLCNEKLKAIGTENTHFSCPYGSFHSDHYTTARDMLKISLYVMENPVFSKIAATKSWKATASGGEQFSWSNTNYLIAGSRTYHYEYATGIKNGYSQNAEYCLAASAMKDGRELYAVTFHAPTLDKRYSDVKRFFETAYSAVE